MGLIQLVGLDGQVLVLGQGVRRDVEIFFIVGEDVQANDVGRRRRKVDAFEMDSGIKRRIHQRVQSGPLELHRSPFLGRRLQRSRIFPALREFEGDVERNVAGKEARGIHGHFVPCKIDDGVGPLDAAFRRLDGRQVVELEIDGPGSRTKRNVEGVHIDLVADPLHARSVHGDANSGDAGDRAGR